MEDVNGMKLFLQAIWVPPLKSLLFALLPTAIGITLTLLTIDPSKQVKIPLQLLLNAMCILVGIVFWLVSMVLSYWKKCQPPKETSFSSANGWLPED